MKKLFIAALAMLCLSAFTASAESYTYNQGYRGNVGIGFGNQVGLNMFEGFAAFETNHGYSFGNGLYVGAGLASYANANSKVGMVPIYANAKFNFLNFIISPFVEARVGCNTLANTETKTGYSCFMVTPMAGLDIWRFSLTFYYEVNCFNQDLKDIFGNMNMLGLTLKFNW